MLCWFFLQQSLCCVQPGRRVVSRGAWHGRLSGSSHHGLCLSVSNQHNKMSAEAAPSESRPAAGWSRTTPFCGQKLKLYKLLLFPLFQNEFSQVWHWIDTFLRVFSCNTGQRKKTAVDDKDLFIKLKLFWLNLEDVSASEQRVGDQSQLRPCPSSLWVHI